MSPSISVNPKLTKISLISAIKSVNGCVLPGNAVLTAASRSNTKLSGRSSVLVFDLANSVWADLEAEISAAVASQLVLMI